METQTSGAPSERKLLEGMIEEHMRELRAIRKALQSIESMLKGLAERSEEQTESFARTDQPSGKS